MMIREDEQPVEYDVKAAHHGVEHTGCPHVAAALEHASRKLTHLNSGQGTGIYEKVALCISYDERIASEPAGKSVTYGGAEKAEKYTYA